MRWYMGIQTVLLITLLFSILTVFSNDFAVAQGSDGEIEITILYDNYAFDSRLKTAWGFSCLIKGLDKTVLFDTGGQAEILFGNMKMLSIAPEEIDTLVFSHQHGDHTGALPAFMKANKNVTVFMPSAFPAGLKNTVTEAGATLMEVDDSQMVCEGCYTTGVLPRPIPEEAIFIKAKEGLVVITGCAHPGIVEIVATAKEVGGQDPYMVIGGFHLLQHSDDAIKDIIDNLKAMGVKKILPTHCTGDKAIALFKEAFGEGFIDGGLGSVIEVEM